MNSRERVLKAMRRNGLPDRVPFEISWGAFTPLLMKIFKEKTNSDLSPDEYFDFDTRYVRPLASKQIIDHKKYFPDILFEPNITFDDWGVGRVPTLLETSDLKYHPLAKMNSRQEIESFEWPDLDQWYRYESLQDTINDYHTRGYAVSADMHQTIFETAWLMRGIEQFMIDMCMNEDIAHTICECLTQIRIRQAEYFAKAGADVLRLGDDIGCQMGPLMSPETYDVFLKNRIKRIIDSAKKINPDILIFMHSCGNVESVIDVLIEVGVEILNPVQPECNDIRMIKSKYKNKLSFWGGIGVQSVMPNGTPDDVRNSLSETWKVLGDGGGWLAAPAHILDPDTPWENIIAFIETAKKLYY